VTETFPQRTSQEDTAVLPEDEAETTVNERHFVDEAVEVEVRLHAIKADRVPLDEIALKERHEALVTPSATPTASVPDTEPHIAGLTSTAPIDDAETTTLAPGDTAEFSANGPADVTKYTDDTDDTDDTDTTDFVDEGYDDSLTPPEDVEVAAAQMQEVAEKNEEAAQQNMEVVAENDFNEKKLAVKRAEAELAIAQEERAEVYASTAESDDGIEAITSRAEKQSGESAISRRIERGTRLMVAINDDHLGVSPAATTATLDEENEVDDDDTPLAVTSEHTIGTSLNNVDSGSILSPRKRSFYEEDSVHGSSVASKRTRGDVDGESKQATAREDADSRHDISPALLTFHRVVPHLLTFSPALPFNHFNPFQRL